MAGRRARAAEAVKPVDTLLATFWPLSGPTLVALIALIGALFGSLITFLISRRTIYINSVTVERSKWIGELRTNIANLSAQVLSVNNNLIHDREYMSSEQFRLSRQEIYRLSAQIKLQLNPFNEIDKNLLAILDQFVESFNNPTDFTWASHDYLLIAHAQWLLKAEWEKVKSEAAGSPRKLWFWLKAVIRNRRYREFARANRP